MISGDTYLINAIPGRCALTLLHAMFAQRIAETDLRLDRKSEILCARFPEFVEQDTPSSFLTLRAYRQLQSEPRGTLGIPTKRDPSTPFRSGSR